jgi:hypothetical protein
MFDRMEKQNYNSPLARTVQVLFVAIVAFILGLDTAKFSGSGWDWGNLAGALGAGALCVLNLFVLIHGFLKPDV